MVARPGGDEASGSSAGRTGTAAADRAAAAAVLAVGRSSRDSGFTEANNIQSPGTGGGAD
jgi:hypothetical protein